MMSNIFELPSTISKLTDELVENKHKVTLEITYQDDQKHEITDCYTLDEATRDSIADSMHHRGIILDLIRRYGIK